MLQSYQFQWQVNLQAAIMETNSDVEQSLALIADDMYTPSNRYQVRFNFHISLALCTHVLPLLGFRTSCSEQYLGGRG